MNSEEEKAFLIGQRKQPREGKISAKKDVKLAMKEKETKAKEARKEERKNRQKKFKETYYENNNDCSQDLNFDSLSEASSGDEELTRSCRARKNVLTPALTITCDALGLSVRDASAIIASTACALGQDPADLNVCRSSLHRRRRSNRQEVVKKLRAEFVPDPVLTLHWDGKIVPDLTGKEAVDRIAVVITGLTTEKLLEVPKIKQGTGKATAEAVFEVLKAWELGTQISAFSFDTTSVNTGK
ncbi:uncharacterized protein [Bemisia tabaci]|uniref:uncharacterized protein n=1 Tax=Bemisia tabaci TaxID=7038 RepID=UPI003B27BD52